jgi:hypothetical protein
VGTPNFIKHKDIKAQIESSTLTGDFNIPLLPIDNPFRPKKINKKNNNAIDQGNLTDIYRIFLQTATKCTFFSAAHETFGKQSYFRT